MDSTMIKAFGANGCFRFIADSPFVSSGGKRVFRGTFEESGGAQRKYDALMVVFELGLCSAFANELTHLSKNSMLGVGPKLLASYVKPPKGLEGFALVEEYVGISLGDAIHNRSAIPDADGLEALPLHDVGTPERSVEAKKIAFDVLVQLNNLHKKGVYHRDLRLPNVCVRRYGKRPVDIRATIIDFDLSSDVSSSTIEYANQPYEHLFGDLMGEGRVDESYNNVSPRTLDMGYFTAILYELITGRLVALASQADLRALYDEWPLFGYRADGAVFSREIDYELDISSRASELELEPVDEHTFPDPALLELVRRTIQHGGYVDTCDKLFLTASIPDMRVFDNMQGLARGVYESYLDQVQDNGLEIEYKTIESQPPQLSGSTDEQVRGIPSLIHALGYTLAAEENARNLPTVSEFSPDEVEYLSYLEHRRWCAERERSGWRYGPEKCVEQRMSDCLLPYKDLPEDKKAYDRRFAQELPAYLKTIGLVILK